MNEMFIKAESVGGKPEMMDTLKDFLKQIIDKNGFEYLNSNAFDIYENLIESETIDHRYARILLLTLLAKVYERANNKDVDISTLSKHIQKELFLKKNIADDFAFLYQTLFRTENISEWDNKYAKGLKEFCAREWSFPWQGFEVWYAGSVHVDCSYTAEVMIRVCDKKLVEEDVKKLVETNPFIAATEIYKKYHDELCKLLDRDFQDYAQADDYYPPVGEDYDSNYECVLEEFCKKHGFEIISYECDGETSDYEPNDNRRW